MVLTCVAFFIIYQGTSAQMTGDVTSQYIMCEYCNSNGETNGLLRSTGLGILNDPNDLAQFLAALLPLSWLRWKKGAYVGNIFLTILPTVVLLGGIYFTHSRGGTIAVAVVLLFGLKDKLSLIGASILTGLGGAGAIILGITGDVGCRRMTGIAWVSGVTLLQRSAVIRCSAWAPAGSRITNTALPLTTPICFAWRKWESSDTSSGWACLLLGGTG